MKKTWMLLTVTAIGLVALSAHAGTDEIQPGFNCKQVTGTPGSIAIDWNGRSINNSTTSMGHLLCPIIRDNAGAPPSLITVHFVDLSTPNDGSCGFGSTDPNTGAVSWSALSYSSGINNNPQPLPVVPGYTYLGGSEYLVCYLPPFSTENGPSAVLSYLIKE